MLECRFAEGAEADLTEIALFIAADSPHQALRFIAEARSFCETLVEQPGRYRLREEYGAGVRVAPFGRYLIFYAERDDALVIERFLHGARHLDWLSL